jgi:hypothetical protein
MQMMERIHGFRPQLARLSALARVTTKNLGLFFRELWDGSMSAPTAS